MQRAGVTNHMVVALDAFTKAQVLKWGSPAVTVTLRGVEQEKALHTGSSHAVSGVSTLYTALERVCSRVFVQQRKVQ